VLTVKDMQSRLRRLEELAGGLGKEVALWRASGAPLLPLERRAYLNGVQDAIAGLDQARAVLARVLRRIEEDAWRRRSLVAVPGVAEGKAAS
jgi:hypothetical protein